MCLFSHHGRWSVSAINYYLPLQNYSVKNTVLPVNQVEYIVLFFMLHSTLFIWFIKHIKLTKLQEIEIIPQITKGEKASPSPHLCMGIFYKDIRIWWIL